MISARIYFVTVVWPGAVSRAARAAARLPTRRSLDWWKRFVGWALKASGSRPGVRAYSRCFPTKLRPGISSINFKNRRPAPTWICSSPPPTIEAHGFDREAAREVISERTFQDAVDADWQKSRAYGVTGVPTFVAAGYGLVGAQPYEALEHLLREAGADRRDA